MLYFARSHVRRTTAIGEAMKLATEKFHNGTKTIVPPERPVPTHVIRASRKTLKGCGLIAAS